MSERARDWFLNAEQRDSVRGYLQETQARALCALLDQQAEMGLKGSLAEIGVFLGKTLIGLARASEPGEHVLGVDPLQIGNQDLAPELTRNLEAHLTAEERGRLTIGRNLSTNLGALDWMRSLKQAARFVHLDGHHARETMLHDLQLAASWLQKGGLVVIDDFLNELHPDLTSGILDGLEAHPQIEPVAVIPRMGHIEEGGSKLVCATRGDAGVYRAALDRALADHLRPWADRMLGREVRVYRSTLPPAPKRRARRAGGAAKPLRVVFALHDGDGAYWLNTAVALSSLAQYARQPIRVTILHDGTVRKPARDRLLQIAEEAEIPLDLFKVELPAEADVERLRQFSAASIFRLLIPQIFRQEDEVVYLDSDLVVNGLDIAELAAAAPKDASISGVRDPCMAVSPAHTRAIEKLGLDVAEYMNSGVLVFRPKLIEDDLLKAFIAFSDAHPKAIHPDQDFLNLHFLGKIHFLDDRFNYQVGAFAKTLLQPLKSYQGKIVHYAGKVKALDGSMGPGLIPFWMHAHAIADMLAAAPLPGMRYAYPVEGEAHALAFHGLRPVKQS